MTHWISDIAPGQTIRQRVTDLIAAVPQIGLGEAADQIIAAVLGDVEMTIRYHAEVDGWTLSTRNALLERLGKCS